MPRLSHQLQLLCVVRQWLDAKFCASCHPRVNSKEGESTSPTAAASVLDSLRHILFGRRPSDSHQLLGLLLDVDSLGWKTHHKLL
ncbi:unnamed protein product [Pleuronectes platessa]|uniref:Uncharacterized protein n=1 Tax=Pleuronectes platessa TaxID=8262 RepID=A0A9N7V6X2_PLEPL|nr:unnamed protein product [Pleuronectes platessa]